MKKSRLGERPSHLKQRGTRMELDDDLTAPPRRQHAAQRPPVKSKSASISRYLKAAVFVIVIAAAAAAGVTLASSDSLFTLNVDHVQLKIGDTLREAAPGETLKVPYSSGLICERISYTGWYRLFPPSSVVF